MAKCDLSIELDEPDQLHEGSGIISGVVHVMVDAGVKCKGLEVQSVWRTHGRGNVATDTAGTETLFRGEWQAGQTYSYRFELPISGWPPTYHGHYLNVDHYVDARAHIPWAFDPQESAPFRVRPSSSVADARSTEAEQTDGGIGRIIVGILLSAFFVAFCMAIFFAGPLSLLFLIIPAVGFLIWFVRKFLPRWLLGEVTGEFPVDTLSPGGKAEGELTIQPNKSVAINAITLGFQSREQVVSGSGSNRTTHRNVIHEQTIVLQDSTTLPAGVIHRFPLVITLPEDAAYSLDLSDNKLIWNATLRVDIPRWPDWVKEIPLTVVPSGQSESKEVATSHHHAGQASRADSDRSVADDNVATSHGLPADADPVSTSVELEAAEMAEQSVTFAETANHLWKLRNERGQAEMLVDAVSGLVFEIEASIERRLLYAGDDDPHVYKDGYAVWAKYTDPPLPMVLYVPHEFADEFEQIGRENWRGLGTIVGWDGVHGRLQVKIERP